MKQSFEIVNHLKKGSPARKVVIHDECIRLIEMVMKINEQSGYTGNLLFPGISENNVEMKLYRLCDKNELLRRSPHKLRKTFASRLLNAGVDPDFVKRQGGWSNIQTMYNSYVRSTTRHEEQIKQLEQI